MSTFGINDSLNDVVLSDPLNRDHPLARGMVAWWLPLPALSGGKTLYNIVGPGDNGSLTNAPPWAGSIYGPGLVFDGVSSTYVDCGNGANLNTNIRTISAFIFYAATGSNREIIKNNSAYILRVETSNLATYWWNQAGTRNQAFAASIPTLTWTHVAGTWDGTTITAYINGVALGTASLSGTSLQNGQGLAIGNQPGGGEPFSGTIIGPCLHTRVLSASEIASLSEMARKGFPDLLNRHSNSLIYSPAWSKGVGTNNITVTAPTNFEVSLDGSTYASTQTVTATNGSANQTVYVRHASGGANPASGTVTNTCGNFQKNVNVTYN